MRGEERAWDVDERAQSEFACLLKIARGNCKIYGGAQSVYIVAAYFREERDYFLISRGIEERRLKKRRQVNES